MKKRKQTVFINKIRSERKKREKNGVKHEKKCQGQTKKKVK